MVKIANSEVIENLGQIDLCICDKTGTLTKNELVLRELYCEGSVYKVKYADDDVRHNDQVNVPKIKHATIMRIRNFIDQD